MILFVHSNPLLTTYSVFFYMIKMKYLNLSDFKNIYEAKCLQKVGIEIENIHYI